MHIVSKLFSRFPLPLPAPPSLSLPPPSLSLPPPSLPLSSSRGGPSLQRAPTRKDWECLPSGRASSSDILSLSRERVLAIALVRPLPPSLLSQR